MSEEILKALLDIKEDTGATRAKVEALEGWMTQHAAEDRQVHERVRQMELGRAHSRGRASVFHMIAVGAGSVAGYVVHFLFDLWKGRGGHP
jgi:hypothetical protein